MVNRLDQTTSPYLLQHANNPVHWYPWSPEALQAARDEDKPIFLSIGYAACHWCHVMAHESFEDPHTAALMNEHFINIKVDREERPDLDGIYMEAVVSMTGSGGWPMSVFLTPHGEPFFGGTYFPPTRRYNLPSFQDVLQHIARAWRDDREQLLLSGNQISAHIKASQTAPPYAAAPDNSILDQAAFILAQQYDWKTGGWGRAPKFPQPMSIEFLLRRAVRGDRMAREIALHALECMSRGGMYDVVGGGFARYSTDNDWLVPHFEKMLYDNAQLAQVYLHAYLLTKDERYRQVCTETLDFVTREMLHSEGGFFSSLDADSEGEEGKYYLWSYEELRALILQESDFEFLVAAYGLTPDGNFEGKLILQRKKSNQALAEQFAMSTHQVTEKFSRLHKILLAARQSRIRPGTDDKILTSWNAWMLAAFAEAGRYLSIPQYTTIAMRNAGFLLENLWDGERLLRTWRDGKASLNAYLEDYAALALGLLALYQAHPDPRWFSFASTLCHEIVEHFSDPVGGFFDTRADHEELLTRPKSVQDNATPSGNAMTALAFLQMGSFTGQGLWVDKASDMWKIISPFLTKYPSAFAFWLTGLDYSLQPVTELALLGDLDDPLLAEMLSVINATYRPYSVLAVAPFPPTPTSPAVLQNRTLLDGKSTAYVCKNFVCKLPVTNSHALVDQLDQVDFSLGSMIGTGSQGNDPNLSPGHE